VPELPLAKCEVIKVSQSKSNSENAVGFIKHPNWAKQIVVEPALLPHEERDGFFEFSSEVVLGFKKGGIAYAS